MHRVGKWDDAVDVDCRWSVVYWDYRRIVISLGISLACVSHSGIFEKTA